MARKSINQSNDYTDVMFISIKLNLTQDFAYLVRVVVSYAIIYFDSIKTCAILGRQFHLLVAFDFVAFSTILIKMSAA